MHENVTGEIAELRHSDPRMIAIIDYGMGNARSVERMLARIGVPAVLTNDPAVIALSTHIILPGVGAFDAGMRALRSSGLLPLLRAKVLEKNTPFLGICLGMQLLTKRSEEGTEDGLGWIDAETVKLSRTDLRIPHMGWNTVTVQKNCPLFTELTENVRFTFAHSYHVKSNTEDIAATSEYGGTIVAAIGRDNIRGVQFHPEKSHTFGMQLLKNFSSLAL